MNEVFVAVLNHYYADRSSQDLQANTSVYRRRMLWGFGIRYAILKPNGVLRPLWEGSHSETVVKSPSSLSTIYSSCEATVLARSVV